MKGIHMLKLDYKKLKANTCLFDNSSIIDSKD